VEFAYNDSVHAATKNTPFYLNYGQHPWRGDDVRVTARNPATKEFIDELRRAHENAQSVLKLAAEKSKENYNAHAWESQEYKPGD
jgi:hypothetical protein